MQIVQNELNSSIRISQTNLNNQRVIEELEQQQNYQDQQSLKRSNSLSNKLIEKNDKDFVQELFMGDDAMNEIVKSPRGSFSSLENKQTLENLQERNALFLKLKDTEKKCSELEAEYTGKKSHIAAQYFLLTSFYILCDETA